MKLQNKVHWKPWLGINGLEQTNSQCICEKLLRKKAICVIVGILALTKSKYFVSYLIKLHCQQADILSGEQEIVTKEYLERF